MIGAVISNETLIAVLKLSAVAFVLSGLLWHDKFGHWSRRLYGFVVFVVAALGCFYLAMVVVERIDLNVEWDFLNYWLAGRVAAEGLPLYEASSYLRQPLPFWPSKDFFSEVIFVGTLYAPPAALLFMPLGFFEYREAFIGWSIVQAVLLVAVTVLMKREFFRDELPNQRLTPWFVVICLVALFAPVEVNLYAGQVNFFMLLLFMLLWRSRSSVLAGVWIGLGMCVKPYFGILVFWLLLRFRFGTMVLAAVTVVLAFASAALVFGAGDVKTYLLDNPIGNAPAHLFTQKYNVSALAVLRRATGALQWTGSPVMYGPYITFALLVTAMTAWSVRRCVDDRWALITCVALGLLLAPQSLWHYCSVLLPAMAFMLVYNGFGWLSIIAVVALFGLASVEAATFSLNLSVWLVAAFHPWWNQAFASAGIASRIRLLLGSLSQRFRKTVSKNESGAPGSA